jgi:exonuclease III
MRVATFNIENLDNTGDDKNPSIELRAPILRQMLKRINAEIICIQEVHAQEQPNHTTDNPKRDLSALNYVLKGTMYENYFQATTLTQEDIPYDKRNLVILSSYKIIEANQYKNTYIKKLEYLQITANPSIEDPDTVRWGRPILHAKIA